MIRCLIVAASAPLRGQLRELLHAGGDVEVIDDVASGGQALRRVRLHRPQVVIVDLASDRTAEVERIREIVGAAATQVVVLSTAGRLRDGELAFRALQAGALEVVARPDLGDPAALNIRAHALRAAVRTAATVAPRQLRPSSSRLPPALPFRPGQFACLGIAASTGGPPALHQLFAALPAAFPVPLLVVQHIAEGFCAGMVKWLSDAGPLKVKLAEDGEALRPGTAYFAERAHLGVAGGAVALDYGPPVGGHRPSGTALFDSLATEYGPRAVGVVLTGMGSDGAAGLQRLRERGGIALAQSGPSCALTSMPKAALEAGAAAVELEELAARLTELLLPSPAMGVAR